MKIYTAQRNYDCEGFDIIGVFTTEKSAQECCRDDAGKGDSHEVEEHELQDT
jgi:hypothetical protein